MNKYEEFKSRKILTVKELIEKLEKLPKDSTLQSVGADIGGCDSSIADYISIEYNKKDNVVFVSHMEHEMYKALKEGLINRDQFNELNKLNNL